MAKEQAMESVKTIHIYTAQAFIQMKQIIVTNLFFMQIKKFIILWPI